MAELGGGGGGGKKKGGKVRVKKSSTRIDMTPMVDLAFLLLTFFVMTTTLNKPQAMQVTMPDKPKDGDEQPEVNEKNVLTLVLGENDKIYWYMGITDPKVEVADFSATGIRKVLLEKKAELPKLIVLIKSMDEARYKNMVDILDEMNISSVQRFALVDITPVDKELVKESQL
ncbi:MAG: biopolymer transporter ExbD [Cyclobacteriaceae bacterium]|nr:biopolymer transporter ExbD [Cyclobacteriaceae bacterium]